MFSSTCPVDHQGTLSGWENSRSDVKDVTFSVELHACVRACVRACVVCRLPVNYMLIVVQLYVYCVSNVFLLCLYCASIVFLSCVAWKTQQRREAALRCT